MIVRCYTSFDITVDSNRNSPTKMFSLEKRNAQINFDTILQVISMRSQPEIKTYPEKIPDSDDWMFEFEVFHTGVFEKNENKLGLLEDDCNNVPMIGTGNAILMLNSGNNIRFEVVSDA